MPGVLGGAHHARAMGCHTIHELREGKDADMKYIDF